jgi:hypothetical protein
VDLEVVVVRFQAVLYSLVLPELRDKEPQVVVLLDSTWVVQALGVVVVVLVMWA